MPRPSIEQLNLARRRSGNLGGRPRKPTRDEARDRLFEELVPKSFRVLNEHLDKGGDEAVRAALRVIEHAVPRAQEFEVPMDVEAKPTDEELAHAIDEWRKLKGLDVSQPDAVGRQPQGQEEVG